MDQLSKNKYDLIERTAQFGETIIVFCKILPRNPISDILIKQIIRSGTSVGANYAEATNANSKKDFRNKIYLCKKECQETKHWLRMIERYLERPGEDLSKLKQEAQELLMIFQKICSSLGK